MAFLGIAPHGDLVLHGAHPGAQPRAFSALHTGAVPRHPIEPRPRLGDLRPHAEAAQMLRGVRSFVHQGTRQNRRRARQFQVLRDQHDALFFGIAAGQIVGVAARVRPFEFRRRVVNDPSDQTDVPAQFRGKPLGKIQRHGYLLEERRVIGVQVFRAAQAHPQVKPVEGIGEHHARAPGVEHLARPPQHRGRHLGRIVVQRVLIGYGHVDVAARDSNNNTVNKIPDYY